MRGQDGCRWSKRVAEGSRHVSGVCNMCLGVVGGRNGLLRPKGLRCVSEGCRWSKQVTEGLRRMSNAQNTCLGVVGGRNTLLGVIRVVNMAVAMWQPLPHRQNL